MGKFALFFAAVVALSTYYITSSVYQLSPTSKPQRTWVDNTGKLHVMGIVLGESTVRDAELAFRSRADAAIFLYPLPPTQSGNKQFRGEIEAYFPSIADHSKVILELEVSATQIEAMRQRSTMPRVYPNGVIRMNLGDKDVLGVQNMVIRKLTLIPSITITEDILHAQFGNHTSKSSPTNTLTIYHYPDIGLTAEINHEGKDKLMFVNP